MYIDVPWGDAYTSEDGWNKILASRLVETRMVPFFRVTVVLNSQLFDTPNTGIDDVEFRKEGGLRGGTV